ncbi:MAG: right-handed parallel beta-helix repeat-containing protein [Kiritimatiellaeota bacterium]|nr:right-handed parallel beta-helix repeat-containing protein [Kiritimatiellota bacterium]
MKKQLWVTLFAALAAGLFAKAEVVDVATCGARADDLSDSTPAVRAALEKCRATHATKLVFPAGRYDFWPDLAQEKYCYISNNDEGLKRIAFPLLDIENLEIDGQGARFVFHGQICPFVLDKARNITLKNFSIDWVRTFHSEGKVLGSCPEGLDVEFSEAFPYDTRNGVLRFTDGKPDGAPQTTVKGTEIEYPYGSLLEFDAVKRETAYQAHDYWARGGIAVQPLGGRKVRLLMSKLKATPGNIMVFGAATRDFPAFTVSESAGVTFNGVNIYHCGGMGVIAQRSRDIELDHVQVTPAPNSSRIVSITADATHFVNCAGKITMRDCLFENQKDDATNIHGIYVRVMHRLAPDAVLVKLVHPQQAGFDFIRPGMKLELVHGPSMVTYAEAVVKTVERLNKEFSRVVFAAPLPAELIEGDARFWYEQAGVRDVVIRKNRFVNCNYGVWGNACIQVGSGIAKECRATSRYNRGIVIEDNLFRGFDPRLLNLYCVDGLTFRNNKLEKTTDYPAPHADAKPFIITDCDRVSIQEN